MKKKVIWSVVDILLAIAGLICLGIRIFVEGTGQSFLIAGMLCCAIALILNCIIRFSKNKNKSV